jgi:hypothetical protein
MGEMLGELCTYLILWLNHTNTSTHLDQSISGYYKTGTAGSQQYLLKEAYSNWQC